MNDGQIKNKSTKSSDYLYKNGNGSLLTSHTKCSSSYIKILNVRNKV